MKLLKAIAIIILWNNSNSITL